MAWNRHRFARRMSTMNSSAEIDLLVNFVFALDLTTNTYPFQGIAMQAVDGVVHHRHKYVRCGAEMEF